MNLMNSGFCKWLVTQRAGIALALSILGAASVGNVFALQCVDSTTASRLRGAEAVIIGRAVQFVGTTYASISHGCTYERGQETKCEWKLNQDPSFQVTIQALVKFKGDRDTYDVLIPFGRFPWHPMNPGGMQRLVDEPWLFYIGRTTGIYEGAPLELQAEAARLNSGKPELLTWMSSCTHNVPLKMINADQLEELRRLGRELVSRETMVYSPTTVSQHRLSAFPEKPSVDSSGRSWKAFLLFLEGVGLIVALLDFTGWSKRLQDGIDHYRFRFFFWLLNKKHEKLSEKIIQILWFPAFALSVAITYGLFTGAIWWLNASMLWLGITLVPLLMLYVGLPLIYNLLLTINRSPSKTMGFASLVVAVSSFVLQRISVAADFNAY